MENSFFKPGLMIPPANNGSKKGREKSRPYILYGLKRLFRFWYLKLIRLRESPHSIAMGLSVGVFVGCLPIIPLQTLTALILAFIIRCSKIAAAAGTWVTNPLYAPFVYYGMYQLGRTIIPVGKKEFEPEELTLMNIINLGWDFFLLMFLGGVLVGLVLAVATYFISVYLISLYHRKRELRMKIRKRIRL